MKRPWLPTALLAAAIVIAAVIGSLTISSVVSSQRELISVKGLAQVEFDSDVIVWNGQFERKAKELNTAYALIKKDADVIRKYLVDKGVNQKEIVFGSVAITKSYQEVPAGDNLVRVFDGYQLIQSIKIESKNVDYIEFVSREISIRRAEVLLLKARRTEERPPRTRISRWHSARASHRRQCEGWSRQTAQCRHGYISDHCAQQRRRLHVGWSLQHNQQT
jgi:hypothetical protein